MFLTTVAKQNSLCQFPLNSRLCQGCGAGTKTSGHFNCPGACAVVLEPEWQTQHFIQSMSPLTDLGYSHFQ